jgi:hypothetical protein
VGDLGADETGRDPNLSTSGPVHPAPQEVPTGRYEIRVKGRVSDQTASAFDGLTLEVHPVETVLHGDIADQAALHGLLDRVQALGLELIEVRRLPPSVEGESESPR